jgi:hypothetical protein
MPVFGFCIGFARICLEKNSEKSASFAGTNSAFSMTGFGAGKWSIWGPHSFFAFGGPPRRV